MPDPATQTVLKGVAITSSLCGVAAGLYGGLRHGAPSKFILYSTVNSGIVAATFFSIREYVVGPVLVSTLPGRQYQVRRQGSSHSSGHLGLDEPPSLSWTDVRTSNLLGSGISGGLAGGILNAWKRGSHGLAPGLTTGALMCTLLQWCFNEFDILRIRYVSANLVASPQNGMRGSTDTGKSTLTDFSTSVAIQPTSVQPPTPRSPVERILSILGQPVSDERYLKRLKMERESYLRRITELEERKKK